ncbi:MAG: hypothetical protein CSA85_00660 [Alphaproteobacteria bacterium]|nr:MAG: hypothetical protein CSA85_00660 [Alphaproteobacteria bacterium]
MRVLPKSLVIAATRNEGPYLLEWIAWQKMLGFERVLILHNDCTDHSPQMLRLLERAGWVYQKRHFPKPNQPPKTSAHRTAMRHHAVADAEWAFVCDVDEFLVVHVGDKSVAALADVIAPDNYGMCVHWRVFGTGGAQEWRDGLVHRMFTRSGPEDARQNSCFKTLVKNPTMFRVLNPHGPQKWLGGDRFKWWWNEADRKFILADGSHYAPYHPSERPKVSTEHNRITNQMAQVNHYALQSVEKFNLKRPHLSSAAHIERYNDDFFRRFDRNEEENLSALTYEAEFDRVYAEICAVPGVMRLHHLCCADLLERSAALRDADPLEDPRYLRHRDLAASLPKH